ncbi:MAG: hypothetical protein GKR95_11635 [Gammaproteobacteria bacterium]|nr:hypothetical protein [Gammaproteobacteria bacterium]NKB62730.1 hypothetical protein [Gammaproteobacteria bacterium]
MFTNQAFVSMIPVRIAFFALLLLFYTIPSLGAGEPVGETKVVVGKVIAKSGDGDDRTLEIGSAIYEGDLLVTGPRDFAVVVMVDQTRFTLKPGTSFEIKEVKAQTDSARVFTNLLKGGLKVVTGQVAKTQPENFSINTTLGSIGVRGTRFDVWLCLDDRECELEYRLLRESVADALSNGRLLFVRVTQGITTLLDCDGLPEVGAGKMGVSDGTAGGCSIIDVPPEMSEQIFREADEELDESLSTLEAPLLQQFDFGDVLSLCNDDPLCIQCDGDPACMQCNGDASCYDCQSDPLCSQCAGDETCIACNGDPLCIQCGGDDLCVSCNADSLCIQCNSDALCISCNADASCIQCDGDALCHSCGNDSLCLCDGDEDCMCGIDSSLPQCQTDMGFCGIDSPFCETSG